MEITRTYKFKMYKSDKVKNLHRQIDVSGIIWNHCIALHRKYYALAGKHLHKFALSNHIVKLKKLPKYSFWKMVGSQAIQDIVERIDKSYKTFFKNVKRKVRAAPPKFQKVKRYKSFTLKQTGWKLLGGRKIKIQGKVYRFFKSREIPENVKTVTVKRDSSGNLFLYFVVKEAINVPSRQGSTSVGFDFGMKIFLTASDGTEYKSPLFLNQSLDQLAKAQRKMSSKVKFSEQWKRESKKVNQIHAKVVNQRRDYFFKLAHELTSRYDILSFEDLNMKGMQRMWGKKISDLARSEFMSILEYIATIKGKIVVYIDRFYPSSKTCHCCFFVNKLLTILDREWVCTGCGVIHDRDLNAAINIEREGASSLNLGDVRRVLAPANAA